MGRAKKWKILAWINFFMIWVWGNAFNRLQLDPALIVPMIIGTAFIIMACLDLAWCIENVSKQNRKRLREEDHQRNTR